MSRYSKHCRVFMMCPAGTAFFCSIIVVNNISSDGPPSESIIIWIRKRREILCRTLRYIAVPHLMRGFTFDPKRLTAKQL